MNKLKRVKGQTHSGQSDNIKPLRILNITALLLLSTYNVMQYFINDKVFKILIIYTILFLILSVITYIVKHKIILYVIYMIIGLITIALAERVIEYSGTIFILFACGIFKNQLYHLISFTLSFISLSIRLTILGDTVPVSIQMLLLFCFLSATAYFIFFKHKKRRVDLWKEITEKEKAILKLFMRGNDYSQISRILNIGDKKESIRTSITRCRNLSGCENDIQFGIWLSDKG